MVLNKYGIYAERPGAEFWYSHYWKPRMLAVWIYELVRRMAKLQLETPKLSGADRALLRSWPPYPTLTLRQKQLLCASLVSQLDHHPSGQLLGPGEFAIKGQLTKLGDWRQIEALDLPPDDSEPEARNRARKYIRRYWTLVRSGWQSMEAGEILAPRRRPRHELSGRTLSRKRLQNVLKAASRPTGKPQ
jgi:hypothetical protein